MTTEQARLKATIDALQEEVNNTLSFIADDLPSLVHENPASFESGYNTGMKAFCLTIDRILNNDC